MVNSKLLNSELLDSRNERVPPTPPKGLWQSFLHSKNPQHVFNPSLPAQHRKQLVAGRSIAAAAASTGDSCEFASLQYFFYCGIGGLLACGLTHLAVTPLDIVKCRLQVDAEKYKNIGHGFKVTIAESGIRGLGLGWAPTLLGYSLQGFGKFGFYEAGKVYYSSLVSDETAYEQRMAIYLAASASAELVADLALCPFEACKVRMQTQPGFANTLRVAMPKIFADEGLHGFFKGVVPLWARQVPYTVMKFTSFERTIELMYRHVTPKPRSECTKGEQLAVTFVSGYIAGVLCAVVSHPADTVVSKLNKEKGASMGDVVRKIGFWGLWAGLVPRIVMVGTLTAGQWFIYDSVKVWLRIPRPPPAEMPESLKRKYGVK